MIWRDNDSIMQVLLACHTYNDKGCLPSGIPTPNFLVDPSHRVKVISNPSSEKVTDTLDPRKCKKIDANRLKNILGAMLDKIKIRILKNLINKPRHWWRISLIDTNGVMVPVAELKISLTRNLQNNGECE